MSLRPCLFSFALLAASACADRAPATDLPRDDADASVEGSCYATGSDPIAVGRCLIERAAPGVDVPVLRADDPRAATLLARTPEWSSRGPESFALVTSGGRTTVVGRDDVGGMYGAMELAERLRLDGPRALASDGVELHSPAVPVRAANLFLVLPQSGEAAWWLRDRGFWRAYLAALAEARIDVLDLHGMFDPRNTLFPNALLYFATSATHPGVGVAPAERAENLAALRDVVAMAARVGIRVALMTYRSDTSLTGQTPAMLPDGPETERYTAEAAEDLARSVPGLWRLGFRVGESGHDAGWYERTFVRGVRASGTRVGIATRTWGTNPSGVASIARASGGDLLLEAKFNGEHLGAPYPIVGSHWSGPWAHYSYESYLDNPVGYQLVFQVRAGGTHRVFRQASFEQARRAVATTTLAGAAGFTYEAAHAYTPQRAFLHRDAADRFSPWTFRRDELAYQLWGRLGYDPTTPERVFRASFAARVGTDALWAPLQAASEVVPWITQGFICGPDHRDAAPELEWGGEVSYLATPPRQQDIHVRACAGYHGPIDPFAVASADETADDLVRGRPTARIGMGEVAGRLLESAARARAAATVAIDPARAEARDVVRECLALAHLGEYFGHKLRAATALAVYQRSGDPAWRDAARREASASWAAWRALAAHTDYIAPFAEPLRMSLLGFNTFHWSMENPWMELDARDLDAAIAAVNVTTPVTGIAPPDAWFARRRAEVPGVRAWSRAGAELRAVMREALPPGTTARVLWKPLTGREDFRAADATVTGDVVAATLPADAGATVLAALELTLPDGRAARVPDVRRETPWATVPR